MRNYVLKMICTLNISNFASVILDFKNSEAYQIEDFLSILNPSEITKTTKNGSKWANKKKFKICICFMFEIFFNLGIYPVINNSFNQCPNNYYTFL